MEDLKQDIENSNLIYASMRNFPNPSLTYDNDANDSDKTITVPTNTIWRILSIHIQFTTDATTGNRRIQILYANSSNHPIFRLYPGVLQAASLERFYTFAPNFQYLTTFFNTKHLYHPSPLIILPPSSSIHIWDSPAISPSGDDMIISILKDSWDIS